MAARQQVCAESSNKESPEQETSRSRTRYKASNMCFEEMVEMVDILLRTDYDGNHGPYRNPNARKAKIMAKVVRSLHRNFGVRRSKDQFRKRWELDKMKENIHDVQNRVINIIDILAKI
ncbi:hypothetical protein AB205_0138150 [Aquarana catesbeiana]|uniref:Uncharacterized protein n=1 Tax=Aquarana catesbeiana TaxID=8400 RepID=A0A2G9SM36_AQUCT|nr:hypothetical protein AB205_0138150 [Aquarana catesbeiana]